MKGGYKIVSLKNESITVDDATGVTVVGIYESIEGNYRKPVLLTDLVIDDVELPDEYVQLNIVSDDFVGIVSVDEDGTPLLITITDDDKVTITTYTPQESGDGDDTEE